MEGRIEKSIVMLIDGLYEILKSRYKRYQALLLKNFGLLQ